MNVPIFHLFAYVFGKDFTLGLQESNQSSEDIPHPLIIYIAILLHTLLAKKITTQDS